MDKWDPNWKNSGLSSRDNYWAGAKKACDDIGMSLADKSTLLSLGRKTTAEKRQLGLPTGGWFWSSSERDALRAYDGLYFSNGYPHDYHGKDVSFNRVLCVGD